MNKAFIFDMDGVIVDSERVWEVYDKKFFTSLLGSQGYEKIKESILGSTTETIYDAATKIGLVMDKDMFVIRYDELAIQVYQQAKLTRNIDELIDQLISQNFKLGLVTASRQVWIDQVLPRLKKKNCFSYIVSLGERNDLRPKPYPDGYNELMQKLKSKPERTIVLEDSQKGITASKTTGALTICLRENLSKEYQPVGADKYIENIQEVIAFIKKL